ncbi:hypothetical protein [Mycolicibacterium sp. CR10]|uniref:hypothetical protein n=1 Tax=Mycolicibacterium sp. CR10 TaxID=2562314 RepID=UPI0010C105C7|nr:hypothetical protein [Mycolicibacterium sp. CR10]
MKLPLVRAHTFVLRVWREDIDAYGDARWAGHVTHLLDERRQYVNSLQSICEFIRGYLRVMDVRDDDDVDSGEEPPR